MDCDSSLISEGVERCPFLRNIGEPTLFNFNNFPPIKFPTAQVRARGPIFEDGPGFDNAFRLFHGKDGVIPLAQKTEDTSPNEAPKMSFNPLAASAATISLSAFGPAGGAFNFDAFMAKQKKDKSKQTKQENFDKSKQTNENLNKSDNAKPGNHLHEALSSEWLATGKCPIAKSCRAVSGVLPLVAKWLKPPPGMKIKCPPAIVAARAALARTAFAKNLRPQPLPTKFLAIGLLGMATNVPLGVWREHTVKFSPSWFLAVHAAIPFIAMLRKAVNMPKYAIALTIGASILGQVIGSRAERLRLAQSLNPGHEHVQIVEGLGHEQVQVVENSTGRREQVQVIENSPAKQVQVMDCSKAARVGSSTGTKALKLGYSAGSFDRAKEEVEFSMENSPLSQQCAMLALGDNIDSGLQKSTTSVTVF